MSLWPCTNVTDMVTRGSEEGVRIIDRIMSFRSDLSCKRGADYTRSIAMSYVDCGDDG